MVIGYLSTLLLIGSFLRGKVKIFQNLFIPASVIGGIIGLVISSIYLKRYNIEEYNLIKNIPNILVIPIVASVPLGISKVKNSVVLRESLKIGNILLLVTIVQLFIGYIISLIFRAKVYQGFGAELNGGFAGGHGVASLIGKIFKELGLESWDLAQGVTLVFATIGLLFGIIFGILIINIKVRNGKLLANRGLGSISLDFKRGYCSNILEQKSLGRETMLTTNIDTLSYHLGIIMMISAFSIYLSNYFKRENILILNKVSAWCIGMLFSFIVWQLMKKMKLEWSIDSKVKSRIISCLADYAIVSAIATIPLEKITEYIWLIILLSILGLIATISIIKISLKRYFGEDNNSLEREIALFGTSTGVFSTGILLLKICTPDLDTPILESYSLGYLVTIFLGPLIIAISIELSVKFGIMICIFFLLVIAILNIVMLEINKRVSL